MGDGDARKALNTLYWQLVKDNAKYDPINKNIHSDKDSIHFAPETKEERQSSNSTNLDLKFDELGV